MAEGKLDRSFTRAASPPSGHRAPMTAFSQASDPLTSRKEGVLDKAQAHFEKHREAWVTKRYAQLLKQDSPAPTLKPHGVVEDRSAHLMKAAAYIVDRRQEARLSVIRSAASRIRNGRADRPDTMSR